MARKTKKKADVDDIASMACAIRENAKVMEAMALEGSWCCCEEVALSILAAVYNVLVEARNRRGEEH